MAERSHTHVYSRSALTVWRAVPLCCNAMLAQRMRAQRASHTAARAEYHTLACPRSSARPSNHHIWSDIGLATQTTKTVVRGARGTCLQTTCEGRFQCVLGTTHRDRHHATGVVALARVSSPSRRNYEITASSGNQQKEPRLAPSPPLRYFAPGAPSVQEFCTNAGLGSHTSLGGVVVCCTSFLAHGTECHWQRRAQSGASRSK